MKTVIAIVIVILVVGGGYFLFASKSQAPVVNPALDNTTTSAPLETTNPNPPAQATPGGELAPSTPQVVTITYDGTNFTPASVTIKKGDAVKFVNSTTGAMWIASDPHPTHQGYSGTTASQHCPDTAGTAFDECSAGASYTFTFQKIGSWGYHNHANHNARGTIIVQ